MKKLVALIVLSGIGLYFGSCQKEDSLNSTWLEVVVSDVNHNPVDSALVKIFTNGTDWSNSRNAIDKDYTGADGTVVFKDLEAHNYWIEVVKGSMNNWFGVYETDGAIPANQKTTIEITIKE